MDGYLDDSQKIIRNLLSGDRALPGQDRSTARSWELVGSVLLERDTGVAMRCAQFLGLPVEGRLVTYWALPFSCKFLS